MGKASLEVRRKASRDYYQRNREAIRARRNAGQEGKRSDWRQVERTCPTCGTVFSRRPSVITEVNYCSRACSATAIRGQPGRAGEAHPRWKGDAATVAAGRMRAITRYPIRPCDVCGEEPIPGARNIHRHHRDENPLNNEASNIAFLCRAHHAAEHRRLRRLTAKENAS